MRLQYEISITGIQAVERALGSVERRFAGSNRRMARKAGVTPGQSGASSARNQEMKVARLEQGVQRFQHKMALRNIAEQNKAKVAGERAAAKEAATAQRQRIRDDRTAQREQLRQSRVAHRESMEVYRRRQSFTRGAIGTASNSIGGTTRALAGTAATALGLGGGMLVAGSVRDAANTEKSAAVLANLAVGSEGETRDRKQIQNSIIDQANAESIRTGFAPEEIVGALRQYQAKSGMVAEGQKMLPYMTDLADAYGANIGDVGNTAGQVAMTLATTRGIRGDENAEITKQIMAAMAGQAKIGTIEFADLATQMGSLMSATSRFATEDIAGLVNTMGAFAQMSLAGGADSPSEAMVAVKRLSDDMRKYGDTSFKDAGVDVFTDKSRTRLRDPAEVLFDVIEKTDGDMVKSEKMFKLRADKAFAPFQQAFVNAGGGKAGREAMEKLLKSFTGAKVTDQDVADSAQSVRETSAKKFDIAMNELQLAISNEMLPALTRLIPEFERMIPHVEKGARALSQFVEAFAKNPMETVGKVIAAKAAIDIATAGIGAAVRAAIIAAIAGNPPMPLPGTPGTPVVAGGGTGTGRKPTPAGGSGGLVAGTLAALGMGLAFDQANKLTTELGAKTSINPFANSKGQVSTDNMLATMLDTLSFGLTGDQGLQQRGGKVIAELMNAPKDQGAQIVAGDDYSRRDQVRAHVHQTVEAEAATAALRDFTAAAGKATEQLNKVKGEGPNRGNSPSPVKG